jgi:glycosyltransferase involved in cell wall biosynthesis
MQNLPKISIITPSYNQAAFIRSTIESVLSQDYPNLEYIVLDAASTDGTIDILKEYSDKLVWKSEKDRGQSDALNKGFRMATGDILAFINSDDTYEPGALKKVGEFYASHPEANWVTGKCYVIDTHGSEIRKAVTTYKNFWLKVNSYSMLTVLDYVSQPSTFWSREVINQVGLFDEGLHYSMDYDYSLRVGKKFKMYFISDYLANFRVHPASKSGNIRTHFNTDLSISKRYTKSWILNSLHWLHNQMIIAIYNILQR